MNKKKRIEKIKLARLRVLLMVAIRERSGEVIALPRASVKPIILKKNFEKILDNINGINLTGFFTRF